MTNIHDFFELKLLARCPLADVGQFLHKVLDGKCGRAGPSYTTYGKVWSLEEWWQLMDGCNALCAAYFSSAWTEQEVVEQLSDLSTEYQQIVVKTLTCRRDDVRHSVVNSVNGISQASLVDFDWKAKVAVSSDKMASVWEPLLMVNLSLNALGENKSVSLELDRDELKKLVTSLEAADRIVTQLT
jgi:hypothetical protein